MHHHRIISIAAAALLAFSAIGGAHGALRGGGGVTATGRHLAAEPFPFSLVARGYECKGKEEAAGVLTIDACAAKCTGKSDMFIFGRGGTNRCYGGGRCNCYCETAAPWTGKPGSASCAIVKHSGYNLYMYVGHGKPTLVKPPQDKPAAGNNKCKEEVAGLRSAIQSCAASTARDLAAKDRDLAAKDAQLQAQNKQLAARDAEVASLRSALAAKGKEAADAKGELGALRKWRATLSERLAFKDKALADAKADIANHKEQMKAVLVCVADYHRLTHPFDPLPIEECGGR